MLSWWRSRGNAARFDLFMRSSLYFSYLTLPFFVVVNTYGEISPVAFAVTMTAVAVHTALCAWLTHACIEHYLGRVPFPRRLAVAAVLTTAALAAGAQIAFPHVPEGHPDSPGAGITTFTLALLVAALATGLRPRYTALVVAAASAYLFTVATVAGTITITLLMVFFAFVYRSTPWILGLVWEIERSREVRANLAVAEERLRFSRDLHDIVGRNLSVVALKAELAAQLAKRGRPDAVDEMLEVRRIAQESLDELRAVVSGYRTADLAAELAGARSLLASAGIDCRVIGEPSQTGEVAVALGWAVREGVTNALRHSQASSCTIALRGKVLTMTNDGVAEADVVFGSGLSGLRERVTALGGTVHAGFEPPDRFVLTVELP